MHLGVVHRQLEAGGQPFPRSPRSRSRVNQRVLSPLNRGPQGQPSPLRTAHGRPCAQGILPTSLGQAPHGWPMVHHSMTICFPVPRGCCSVSYASPYPLVRNPAMSLSPVPCPVTHLSLFPALSPSHSPGLSRGRSLRSSLSGPLLPSSRVYTPPGRQQHFGAGPLDPHPSGDRFVYLARVAPFPPPSLSPVPGPVTHLGLFPASRAFPFSSGRCAALVTRPSLSRPRFPSSRVYTPPVRQQPFGAGPLDPHPSGDCFVCLALVAPFPPISVWLVCFFLDLMGALLPGPASASPGTRAYSPPGHLLSIFFARHPRPLFCTVCSFPFPCCLVALCFTPSGGALWFWFFFGLPPPPFPLCILPCGTLHPACRQVSTALVIGSRPPSVLVSCPIARLGCGPWRFPAMPGGRPSLASLSSLPSLLSPPPPFICLSPALLLFLSWSVCSPLVFPAPGLYLARSHAPLGIRPVLRPVGQLGRPPQVPLRGDSPAVRPCRPPLHNFLMVGRGGRYGSMLVIGMPSLCARSGVPVCRCWPPASPSSRAALRLRFACFFFWLPLLSRSSLLTRALRVPPAPLCATPASPPRTLTPCHAIAPLPTSYLLSPCGSCQYFSVRPHCLRRPFTRVCHPCVLRMPLSVVPTLFPRVVSHPHPALSVVLLSPILVLCLRSPTISTSRTPWVPGVGGGIYMRTGLWPCLLRGNTMDCWDRTTVNSLTQHARVSRPWGQQ